MKLFHLSDLHIGLRLFNRDLSEDQQYIFDQIAGIAGRERPDVIMIAGDVYDKAIPSAEAVSLFDRFISRLLDAAPEAELMIVSGNHDSAPRLNVYRGLLSRQRVHVIGMPPTGVDEHIERVTLSDEYGPVDFYLLPFVKPSMVKAVVGVNEDGSSLSYDESVRRLFAREDIDASRRNVLVSHQFYIPAGTGADSVERMDGEVCTVGNIDAIAGDVLDLFDYAALGHIHKPMQVGRDTARYCGTPIPCSVSEAGQQKGIVRVELGGKGSVRVSVLPLMPLRQVKVVRGGLQEVLAQGCGDYVTVVLTDAVDLDILDMRDRLNDAFPRLLEIRRENLRGADYGAEYVPEAALDPFELCCAFLNDLDDDERALLRDVVNAAGEVKEA